MQLRDKVRRTICLSGLQTRLRDKQDEGYLRENSKLIFKRIRRIPVNLIEVLDELSDIEVSEEDFEIGLISDLHILDCDFIDSDLKEKLSNIWHDSCYAGFELTDEIKSFLFECYLQYWKNHPRSSIYLNDSLKD